MKERISALELLSVLSGIGIVIGCFALIFEYVEAISGSKALALLLSSPVLLVASLAVRRLAKRGSR